MRDDTMRVKAAVDELSAVWASYALGEVSHADLIERTVQCKAAILVYYTAKGSDKTDYDIESAVTRLAAQLKTIP